MAGIESAPLHKDGAEPGSGVDITYDGEFYLITVTGRPGSKEHVRLSLEDAEDLFRRVLESEPIRDWRRQTEGRQWGGNGDTS